MQSVVLESLVYWSSAFLKCQWELDLRASAMGVSVSRRQASWIAILVTFCGSLLFSLYFRREFSSAPPSPCVQTVWMFEPVERGAIVSSPLVTGDRIYVGVIHDIGFSSAGAVYCL